MSVEKSLGKAPFSLSPQDVAWVRKIRVGMSTAQKIRQLFVHISLGDDLADVDKLSAFAPGGIHRFMGRDVEAAWRATRRFMENAEVPPFITGDIEGGGNHTSCITAMTNQLGLAAANDLELSAEAVGVMAREVSALGVNWTFTPCIDVNKDTTSAIVGTRSYGSDIKTIAAQALVLYVMAVESSLGKSRIFLDWVAEQPGIPNILKRYWHDLPTLLVSFGHPYYLTDAPRLPTLINAYATVASAQTAVLERLLGKAPFTGISPVDAFAGAPDGRY